MSTSTSSRSERIAAIVVTTLALLIGGFFLTTVFVPDASAGAPPVAEAVAFVLVNAAAGGLLWWHRRFPLWVFAGIFAIHVVAAGGTQLVVSGALMLPLWFGVFAVAVYAPFSRAVVVILAAWVVDTAVTVLLAIWAGHTLSAVDVVAAFVGDVGFFYIASSLLGIAFRIQDQRARDATEHARLVEEHARSLHAEAVATERNRLARDLHDLAAHELVDALLAVRALQVTRDDPMLAEIEQKTGRALENMRTVVRTLREGEGQVEDPEHGPLAEVVGQLLDELRAGQALTSTARLELDAEVDDSVASTVLSTLKETVLNASRHAPGAPVAVVLEPVRSEVHVTVTNPLASTPDHRPHGTGYGLIGTEERARLLGGSFDAGATTSEEWVARLRLPVTSAHRDAEHSGAAR